MSDIALHTMSAYGRTNLSDTDILRLAEANPHLLSVFEELQFLRQEVVAKIEEIEGLQERVFYAELHAA